ncbi:kinesin-like protein KIN-14U [Ipomoea triloba]|uniref:kinesin-like protein KIN-14U n=1 Tax=Ipomoea triloba TaxID=35885 RepID=UPI00125DE6FA|nr:kinesin-like protein KIN-14U [Ipomoea triloba]XP_031117635.1 kinesin-like protein KIN-14U [Ipomoea triloba]
MESNLGSTNGMPEASEESPATSIDVNVVLEDDKHKLEQRILTLEGEIVNLRLKQRSLDEKRREALNKIIDIKGNEDGRIQNVVQDSPKESCR